MEKRYRLGEIEDVISEMDFMDVDDDILETEEDSQLIVSGWYVVIAELGLTLREGIVCVWDEEENMFLPDFSVTVISEKDMSENEWLYYEQDGFAVSLGNWLNGRMSMEQIEGLWCELIIPQINNTENERGGEIR